MTFLPLSDEMSTLLPYWPANWLKLGTAWAVVSAAVSTPPELPPEADAPPPDAEEGVEPPPDGADEPDELDEQAASMTAAPTERAPSAIRAAREFGLVFLNRCMRPRIVFIQEMTRPHRHWSGVALITGSGRL
jgi:hypothetical protein